MRSRKLLSLLLALILGLSCLSITALADGANIDSAIFDGDKTSTIVASGLTENRYYSAYISLNGTGKGNSVTTKAPASGELTLTVTATLDSSELANYTIAIRDHNDNLTWVAEQTGFSLSTFKANGGEFSDSSTTTSVKVLAEEDVPVPSWDNAVLEGWVDEADDSPDPEVLTASDYASFQLGHVYDAKWSVTVTFSDAEGTLKESTRTVYLDANNTTQDITLPAAVKGDEGEYTAFPANKAYKGSGWSETSGGDAIVGDSVTVNSTTALSKTYYALWTGAEAPVPKALVAPAEAYLQNADPDTVTALDATATAPSDDGTLSYQWYSNTSNSTTGATAVGGANNETYKPVVTEIGIKYYYCVVTNTLGTESETTAYSKTEAQSNIVKVEVKAVPGAPVITKEPEAPAAAYTKDATATALSVTATKAEGSTGTLSYQWYACDDAEKTGEAVIGGQTGVSYTPSTSDEGTKYYFVRVTDSQTTKSTDSAVVAVTVVDGTYTLSIDGDDSVSVASATSAVTKQYTATVTEAPAVGGNIEWSVTTKTGVGIAADEGDATKGNLTVATSTTTGNVTITAKYVKGDIVYAQATKSISITGKSSGGGAAGGGGAAANVTTSSATNGTIKVSNTAAKAGDKVTVTLTPSTGYEADTLTVKDKSGATVEATKNADGTYTFTMPAASKLPVSVSATFKKAETKPVDDGTGFIDVAADAYYADAVKWAVNHDPQITNGKDATNTFKPTDVCTRAEAVTFLYRAAGAPDVAVTNQFKDVASDTWYAKAVAWAVANGITNGKDAVDTFKPTDTCSRAEIVTFLARLAKAANTAASTQFKDVSADDYFAGSVAWAVNNGITNGKNATDTFLPKDGCTRAEIVTFLYRDFVK